MLETTKSAAVTQGAKCSAETLEEFLARGGRIERIEDHPNPEGRVLRRGSRNPGFRLFAMPVRPARRS
jgi:hypothetical protein